MPDQAAAAAAPKPASLLTVLVALAANALIAVAKSVAALITGSASMVAEAAHSWADTGNEVFLLIAERTSQRPSDKLHPYGYGRAAYVWSMFAAFGLFVAGAGVSVWHGITSLDAPETGDTDYLVAYVVLAIAFVLEGTSFRQAVRQARTDGAKMGLRPLRFIERTSNPTLRAVFVEDASALIGLLLAGAGLALHQITGDPVYDALGSIAVGLLLGVMAVFLIRRNLDFLVGQPVLPAVRENMLRALYDNPEIEKVTFVHPEFVGPARVLLIAAVDLTGNRSEDEVAAVVNRVEQELTAVQFVDQAVLTLSTPGMPALPRPTRP